MGEVDNDRRETVNEAHEALLAQARRYADIGLAAEAARLARKEPYRASLREAPIVLDTDIGGDPDDAVALAVAARHLPQLALVCTSDEQHGQRARLARHLLDLLGRPDLPVVAGEQVRDAGRFLVADLVPAAIPAQPAGVNAAVAGVLEATDGPVRWVGLGPMSNLAAFVGHRPDLAPRLAVTQMGGALAYRDPGRGEHNFRLDPQAATAALTAVYRAWLVTSDVTFAEQTEITVGTAIYQQLAADAAPDWARLLREHLDRWFAQRYPGSMQHDPLALSVALELPFVDFRLDKVAVDELGRMRLDPDGAEVFYSHTADYPAFWRWLSTRLSHDAADA